MIIINPRNKKNNILSRFTHPILILAFFCNLSLPTAVFAQSGTLLNLPVPGAMVSTSEAFVPVLLKGMTLHMDDPLKFDFIVDSGDAKLDEDQLRKESDRLVKYFLASLTIPKDDLWVNLSPYEKDRIIPDALGKTDLGRDMLAEDYILKQLTASLMYPGDELGDKFWQKVRLKAKEQFGTDEIPTNTFNKVWIVPEVATVYEKGQTAFIVESRLKVMLDQDYLALQKNQFNQSLGTDQLNKSEVDDASNVSSQIIREIIIPEIEKEVNEGKNFAKLRQIYHSLVLAKWYKETIKNTLLSQIYVDRNKISGIETDDQKIKEKIYERYIEAFKAGVYNVIKEEYDPASQEVIPRKYFSGGIKGDVEIGKADLAMMTRTQVKNPSLLEIRIQSQGVQSKTPTDAAMTAEKLEELRQQFVALAEVKGKQENIDEVTDLVKKVKGVIPGLSPLSSVREQNVFLNSIGLRPSEGYKFIDAISRVPHAEEMSSVAQEAIYKIAINELNGKTDHTKRMILTENDEPLSDEEKSKPVKAMMLAFAGNPETLAHLLILLKAMAETESDVSFFSPTFADFRKLDLIKTYLTRLELVKQNEEETFGFVKTMSALKIEETTGEGKNGEDKVKSIFEMNKALAHFSLIYGAGGDHYGSVAWEKIVKFGQVNARNIAEVLEYLKDRNIRKEIFSIREKGNVPEDFKYFVDQLKSGRPLEDIVKSGNFFPVIEGKKGDDGKAKLVLATQPDALKVKFQGITKDNRKDFLYYVNMSEYQNFLGQLMEVHQQENIIPLQYVEFIQELIDSDNPENLLVEGSFFPVLDTVGKLYLTQADVKKERGTANIKGIVKLEMAKFGRGADFRDTLRDRLVGKGEGQIEVTSIQGLSFDVSSTALRKGIAKLIQNKEFDISLLEAIPHFILTRILHSDVNMREYLFSLARYDEGSILSNDIGVLMAIDKIAESARHGRLLRVLQVALNNITSGLKVEENTDNKKRISLIRIKKDGNVVMEYTYSVLNQLSEAVTGRNTLQNKETVILNKSAIFLVPTLDETVFNDIEQALDNYVKQYNKIDKAVLAENLGVNPDEVGGIDFNDIDINYQGDGIDFQFDEESLQPLLNMDVEGFAPIIINIQPILNLMPFLGFEQPKNEDKLTVSALNEEFAGTY